MRQLGTRELFRLTRIFSNNVQGSGKAHDVHETHYRISVSVFPISLQICDISILVISGIWIFANPIIGSIASRQQTSREVTRHCTRPWKTAALAGGD